ncbi:MAG: M13 family metallopeptidase N-terminal domain-containing protein, partial [Candidatus Kaiserbacteria bacterium]|nr:M13 family metallopeptidase N-terminal domain-containing protein [Candidatus Kaiserbacteria bacterium]
MTKKQLGFDTKDIDAGVRPQDDFFHYASGGWMKRNPIPKAESRWGSFTMLRHTTDKQLRILLKKVVETKHAEKGSAEQMIRDFYLSGMNLKHRKALGLSPLKKQLELVEKIKTPEDMVRTIAQLERVGLSGVWGSSIDQDMKNSEKYIIYMGQGGLGMPDRDYYLKDDAESKRVRKAYEIHLIRIGELVGNKDAKQRAAVILEIETALAKASMKKEDLRDVDKTYHKKTIVQLKKLTPRIDWKEYFEILGTSPKEVVVMQPDFFVAVEKLFYSFPIESWKTYLATHIV